jgi:hypothetical protein
MLPKCTGRRVVTGDHFCNGCDGRFESQRALVSQNACSPRSSERGVTWTASESIQTYTNLDLQRRGDTHLGTI